MNVSFYCWEQVATAQAKAREEEAKARAEVCDNFCKEIWYFEA